MAALRILLATFALILLFGCITMDYVQKVERNGDSEITVSADLSTFMSMMESMGNASEGEDPEAGFQESCAEAEQQDSSITCTYSDGTLILTKQTLLSEGLYEFESEGGLTSTRYTLTLRKLPDAAESMEGSLGDESGTGESPTSGLELEFTDPKAQEQAEGMRSIFMVTYAVEMPGTIVSAEGAEEIEGSRATFDVLTMMENGQNIVVVSEETDNTLIYLGGIVVVVLMLGAAFYLFRKQSAGGSSTGTGKAKANPELVKYAKENLKAGHAPGRIRKSLVDAGWPKDDVDNALDAAQ